MVENIPLKITIPRRTKDTLMTQKQRESLSYQESLQEHAFQGLVFPACRCRRAWPWGSTHCDHPSYRAPWQPGTFRLEGNGSGELKRFKTKIRLLVLVYGDLPFIFWPGYLFNVMFWVWIMRLVLLLCQQNSPANVFSTSVSSLKIIHKPSIKLSTNMYLSCSNWMLNMSASWRSTWLVGM